MNKMISEHSYQSELSKSFWSAKISVKFEEDSAHERLKHIIPRLDMSRLPVPTTGASDSESFSANNAPKSGNMILLQNNEGIFIQ